MKSDLKILGLSVACILAGFIYRGTHAEDRSAFGLARRFAGADKAAMALAIDGDLLYAGAGDSLFVFSVAEPLQPKLLGEVAGIVAARQVAVQSGFAYVTAREGGLWIVDCTDPAKPRIRSRFDTCELATGVDVAGDVCFCGQRQNGVEFIDVSDPDRPQHIAMRKTDESQSVLYRDGWLYSGEWGTGRVTVFDAHDMRNIREVGRADLHGYGDGLCAEGGYLYAARGHHSKHRTATGGLVTDDMKRFGGPAAGGGMGHGLDIFDVSDPKAPKRVGEVDYPPFYSRGNDMWTSRVSGDLVVAAQTHNGLFAVDVADKTAPKVVGRWTHPNPKLPDKPGDCVGSVAIGDGVVYAAVKGVGFFAITCARARRTAVQKGRLPIHAAYREPYPAETESWHVWKPHEPGQCRALAVKGDIVYAACGDAGLYALQVLPENAGFKELAKLPRHERVYDVSVCGDRIFTAEGEEGFGVYDISGRPTDFREIARLPRIGADKDRLALCVTAVDDRWAFFSSRHGTDLYDVGGLPSFRHVLHAGSCPGWDKYLQDRTVGDGRYIAFNNANTSVIWFDLGSNPPTARQTVQNRLSLQNGVCAFRDGLSIASRNGGYAILRPGELDSADGTPWTFRMLPDAFPGERGGWSRINGIPRSDGRSVVFLSRITRRGALYDFSDVDKPKLVRSWRFSGNPDLAVFHDGRAMIPCGYEGVLLQK